MSGTRNKLVYITTICVIINLLEYFTSGCLLPALVAYNCSFVLISKFDLILFVMSLSGLCIQTAI